MNAEIRSQVENLFGEYVAAIDDDRLEQWPELFEERCRYLITNRENHALGLPHGTIYATSRGMLRDRVSALREANIYESHTYRHIVSAIQVLDDNEGVVTVRSNFLVVRTMHDGDMMVFATGLYLDKLRLGPDGARFVERIVVCDSQKVDTLLSIPL